MASCNGTYITLKVVTLDKTEKRQHRVKDGLCRRRDRI